VTPEKDCANCENVSFAAAQAEEDFKEKLKASFPLNAPYSMDPLVFCRRYVKAIRDWATENLGVKEY